MQNRFIFNFSFHPVNGTENTIALHCQGMPYTVGNYQFDAKEGLNGLFCAESYFVKDSEGTVQTKNLKKLNFTDEESARNWLLSEAFANILNNCRHIIPDKIHEIK